MLRSDFFFCNLKMLLMLRSELLLVTSNIGMCIPSRRFSTERSHVLTALQGILTVMDLRNFIDVLETPTRVANSNEMFENGSFQS